MTRAILAALTAACLSTTALAATPTVLIGDNQSGLEFGSGTLPGKAFTNYAVPNPTYAIKSLGVKIIRVPFLIERMEPKPNGPIDPTYFGYIRSIMDLCKSTGAYCVFDPHNYGDAFGDDITTEPGEGYYLSFIKVFSFALARTYMSQSVYGMGLMNEPHEHTDAVYQSVFQQAIDIIRKQGFKGYVFYPAASYSNATEVNATSTFMRGVTDPYNRLIAEFHCYWDSNGSGTHNTPIADPNLGAERLDGALAWAKANGRRFLLGETGEPEPTPQFSGQPPSAAYVQSDADFRAFMGLLTSQPTQVFGITLWGDGPWWSPSYLFDLYPSGTTNTFDALTLKAMTTPSENTQR